MKIKLFLFAAVCCLMGAAADVVLPYDRETNVVVAAGASDTFSGLLRVPSGAEGIVKTGAGAWTLPMGGVWSRDDVSVDVYGGSVAMPTGGSLPAASATPPAVLAKAAIWLEASTNTVPWSEDPSRVAVWHDVRQTKDGEGVWSSNWWSTFARLAKDENGTANAVTNYPEVVDVETGTGATRPMMYFHGYNSGSHMYYRNTAGSTAERGDVYHAFVAMKVVTSYGFVLGRKDGVCFHPSATTGKAEGSYLGFQNGNRAGPSCRFFLNGRLANANAQGVKTGMQVLEFTADPMRRATIGTMFSDREIKKRYGGDYVGEVVLFTNQLTEVERLNVSEYLLRKWVGEPTAPHVNVRVADDSEVTLSGSALVSGSGTVNLPAGSLVQFKNGTTFAGTLGKEAGAAATTVEMGELPVAPVPGDHFAAARGSYAAVQLSRTVDAADAAKGSAFHAGNAPLVVRSMPNVKSFATESAELILRGPQPSRAVLSTNAYATIANGNGDFEEFTRASPATANSLTTGTKYGWTVESGTTVVMNGKIALDSRPGGNAWWFEFYKNGGTLAGYDANMFYPPDNGNILALKGTGTATAPVSVPETGEYEFSYYGTGRIGYDYGKVTLSLVDESVSPAVTNTFARYRHPAANGWRHYRFLLRNVAAGNYKLVVNMTSEGSSDRHAMFDCFQMRLVSSPVARTMTVEPPNGSFEVTDCPFGKRDRISLQNTVPGWTVVQGTLGSSATEATAHNYEAYFTTRWHGLAGADTGMWFDHRSRYGESQLILRAPGGYAESDAFTLPAGRWRFHYRAARWAFSDWTNWKWNGQNPISHPTFVACVYINGTATDLGSQTLSSYAEDIVDRTLSTTFTVADGDSVKLRMWNAGPETTCAVAVDGVYFERLDDPDGELVANGSFEDATAWSYARNNGNDTNKTDNCYYSNCGRKAAGDANYGYTVCNGSWALLVVQIGQATQPITFTEAGLYRLSFWTRARYFTSSSSGLLDSTYYGGNQIRVWLADGEGVTNDLYRTTSIYSTNFLEHVALFRMDRPGTYTLGIQGCNNYSDHVTTSSANKRDANAFVDLVSIVRTEEDTTPALESDLQLTLGDTARLRLDYAGTNTIKRLRIGGKSVSGLIDASHPSGLVSGPGCIYVPPYGTMVLLR